MDEMKELKDRLSKINELLDKLDEKLVQGEITETKYKELSDKYRLEGDSLKNQITEKELLQEVGLKAEETEPVESPKPEKIEKPWQGYLVGQVIASSSGALLLAVENFGGFYYRDDYAHVYGYVYLGSGFLPTILILLGIGGLLFALAAAVRNLKAKEGESAALFKENTMKSIQGAGFTAILAAVGAVVFIVSSIDTEWWLDGGFYGAFIGGLLTYYFGKQMLENIVE